jgi:flagellar basal-body rod protein FlgC
MNMAPRSVFEVAGRAMSAQLVRLNTTASNLANAGALSRTEAGAYRALKPVFATVYDQARAGRATVDVEQVVATATPPSRRYMPGHPLAGPDGFVFQAAVDPNQELVEMVEAARQYENNVEVMNTAKALMLATLRLGQ